MAIPLRTAYHCSAYTSSSISSLSSACSEDSNPARSSAPTTPIFRLKDEEYPAGRHQQGASGCKHVSQESLCHTDDGEDGEEEQMEEDDKASVTSVSTYASTTPSQVENQRRPDEEYNFIPARSKNRRNGSWRTQSHAAVASSPSDFAFYFPSSRLLRISHTDDHLDGNMNLTVQTDGWAAPSDDPNGLEAPVSVPLTLFHLRMHNLKNRDFSLRRYGRQSGREVCRSTRKYTRPAAAKEATSSLSWHISNVLTRLQSKPFARDHEHDSPAHPTSVARLDSGYASLASPTKRTLSGEPSPQQAETNLGPGSTAGNLKKARNACGSRIKNVIPKATNLLLPRNTTKLIFSNYMQIDIQRRGGRGRGAKRYDFEYWGLKYSWVRRIVRRTDERRFPDAVSVSVEFHLRMHEPRQSRNAFTEIAHIVPEPLSSDEQAQERHAGGWVPRCSMWISDPDSLASGSGAEFGDVVVATGIYTLVDDAIKRCWDRGDRFKERIARLAAAPART